jgi:hypothetical protein
MDDVQSLYAPTLHSLASVLAAWQHLAACCHPAVDHQPHGRAVADQANRKNLGASQCHTSPKRPSPQHCNHTWPVSWWRQLMQPLGHDVRTAWRAAVPTEIIGASKALVNAGLRCHYLCKLRARPIFACMADSPACSGLGALRRKWWLDGS